MLKLSSDSDRRSEWDHRTQRAGCRLITSCCPNAPQRHHHCSSTKEVPRKLIRKLNSLSDLHSGHSTCPRPCIQDTPPVSLPKASEILGTPYAPITAPKIMPRGRGNSTRHVQPTEEPFFPPGDQKAELPP